MRRTSSPSDSFISFELRMKRKSNLFSLLKSPRLSRNAAAVILAAGILMSLTICSVFAADPPASEGGTPSPQNTAAVDTASNKTMEFSGGIMDTLNNKQKLGVGDTVIFQVLEDREDPKPLPITDAGELHIPELGLVKAAGKTCRELAFEVKSRLEQTTYYHATVIMGIQSLNKTISGRRIYLAGQIKNPGPQEVPAGETWTVSRAIMGAGGFTDYADKKGVRLVRAGAKGAPGKTFVLNISDVWEKGQTEKDLSVEPEDLIYIPTRAVSF